MDNVARLLGANGFYRSIAAARSHLEVLHLVGSKDTNTPPTLLQSAARARGGETVRIVPGFDHVCCWESLWPSILNEPPG